MRISNTTFRFQKSIAVAFLTCGEYILRNPNDARNKADSPPIQEGGVAFPCRRWRKDQHRAKRQQNAEQRRVQIMQKLKGKVLCWSLLLRHAKLVTSARQPKGAHKEKTLRA